VLSFIHLEGVFDMASSVLTQSASKMKSVPAAPHPEVKSILKHALNRVVKLLALCDQRIERFTISLATEHEEPEAQDKADKALLSLTRTVLNLHKDLNRYTALVYPSTVESEEQGVSGLKVVGNTLSVDYLSQDNHNNVDVDAMSLDDLKALLEDTRDAANQFASAFNLPLMPAPENRLKTEEPSTSPSSPTSPLGAYYVSDKKVSKQQRKEQKFSNAFFKKA
jgi:hypothetical protein